MNRCKVKWADVKCATKATKEELNMLYTIIEKIWFLATVKRTIEISVGFTAGAGVKEISALDFEEQ